MNINSLDLPAAKRVLIIGFVLGEAALYFLIVKFYFIKIPSVSLEQKVSHYYIRHSGIIGLLWYQFPAFLFNIRLLIDI